jgi:hypothetical protein
LTHCDNDNYGPSTPRRLPFPQPRDEWTARTEPDRDDVTAEALNRGTLRSQMRSARRALSHAERTRAAELVVHRLCGLSIVRRAPAVALYRAFDGELDPGALAQWVTERGRRVLYPRHAPRAPLEFVEPTGWRTPEIGPPIPEGAPIALIEVMKTFTPVRAPVAGTFVRHALPDGASVSPGQPVAWIRP